MGTQARRVGGAPESQKCAQASRPSLPVGCRGDQPQDLLGLTARPPARYLYWTDWGDHSLIGRIGMDGSGRSVIVDTKITWPNGLTLDYVTERIYWADAREDYIEFASLDGSNRHVGQ